MRDETANDANKRGVGIGSEFKTFPQRLLVFRLPFESLGGIVGREILIGFRVIKINVNAVDDAGDFYYAGG